ncbi:hypothetical protein ACF9IK_34490 [Kitasatospora hibisci]|uniref:hypothetical protein n=1 Tax=Kitasatospora hibisci TaxID=3369522 RepID=UPI0037542D70
MKGQTGQKGKGYTIAVDQLSRAFVAPDRALRADRGGTGRSRLSALSPPDPVEARDAFIAGGMERDVVEGSERLDDPLTAG